MKITMPIKNHPLAIFYYRFTDIFYCQCFRVFKYSRGRMATLAFASKDLPIQLPDNDNLDFVLTPEELNQRLTPKSNFNEPGRLI